MTAPRPLRQAQQGLTLIELLIAILLTGIIATYGLGVMQSIIEGHFGVKKAQASLSQLSQMQIMLETDLVQLQPDTSVRNTFGQTEPAVMVINNGTGITLSRLGWLLSDFDSAQRSNLQRVSWSLYRESDPVCRHVRAETAVNDNIFCVVRSYDYEMDTLSDVGVQHVDVLGNVSSMSFSFLATDAQGAGSWQDDWPEGESSVLAVKVAITHADLGSLYWAFPVPLGRP